MYILLQTDRRRLFLTVHYCWRRGQFERRLVDILRDIKNGRLNSDFGRIYVYLVLISIYIGPLPFLLMTLVYLLVLEQKQMLKKFAVRFLDVSVQFVNGYFISQVADFGLVVFRDL